MTARGPLVVGNWKMQGLIAQAVELARGIVQRLEDWEAVEVAVCPPFTALAAVREILRGSAIALGAQDVHSETSGAYTGEISAAMLADLSCRYVIVGHSERRLGFHETDEIVSHKAATALGARLIPIVCVGETLEQREAGHAESVVRAQIEGSLGPLGTALREVVVAYEPIWAIGTGRTATAAEAQQAHWAIRQQLEAMAGPEVASPMHILYGGSLKPENAAELFSRRDVDGGLVGGASLDADSFVEIVRAAASQPSSSRRNQCF